MGRGGRRGEAYVTRDSLAGDECGFTLIEIMIAIIIMTVGVLAVANVFPSGLMLSVYGKDQSKAADLAQRWVEDLKNNLPSTLAADAGDFGTLASQYYDINGNGTTAGAAVFTVDLQVQYWVWNASTSQYVVSGTPYTAPGSGQYVYRVSVADALAPGRAHGVYVGPHDEPERVRGGWRRGPDRPGVHHDQHVRVPMRTRRRPHLRGRLADARGMTLVELMTVLVVFSVVMGAVVSLLITGLAVYAKGGVNAQAQVGSQVGIDRLQRDLRQARRLVTGIVETVGATSFTFNTQCSPTQISFALPHMASVTLSDSTIDLRDRHQRAGRHRRTTAGTSATISRRRRPRRRASAAPAVNAVGPYLIRIAVRLGGAQAVVRDGGQLLGGHDDLGDRRLSDGRFDRRHGDPAGVGDGVQPVRRDAPSRSVTDVTLRNQQ